MESIIQQAQMRASDTPQPTQAPSQFYKQAPRKASAVDEELEELNTLQPGLGEKLIRPIVHEYVRTPQELDSVLREFISLIESNDEADIQKMFQNLEDHKHLAKTPEEFVRLAKIITEISGAEGVDGVSLFAYGLPQFSEQIKTVSDLEEFGKVEQYPKMELTVS